MAEMNVAETQVDVVASAWKNAEAGYDELSGGLSAACKNATELASCARGTGGQRRRIRSVASGGGVSTSGQCCVTQVARAITANESHKRDYSNHVCVCF